MQRRIQYAQTADGVSIAYWTMGEGPALVYMAGGPWHHIELWDLPECRRWYELLSQDHTLVRYDVRGTGSSDRDVQDYSLAAQVSDLAAAWGYAGCEVTAISNRLLRRGDQVGCVVFSPLDEIEAQLTRKARAT